MQRNEDVGGKTPSPFPLPLPLPLPLTHASPFSRELKQRKRRWDVYLLGSPGIRHSVLRQTLSLLRTVHNEV